MSVLARSPAAITRRFAGRLVVLGPADDEPLVLTGSGPLVWDAVDRETTVDALAEGLAARFEIDVDVVRRDIGPLVDGLVAVGALVVE